MRYICFCLLTNPVFLLSESYKNPTATHDLLRQYLGDFTDSDGDGMTDFAENKYGYDPFDEGSLPQFNLGAEPSSEYPIPVVFEVLKNPYFWEQATDLGQGWKLLDWFGYYYLPNPSNSWIYHSLFGWIYLIEISNGSFWLYSDEYGWLWSRKDIFPIFYSTDKTGWIYLENERYYDYSKRVWVD